MALSLNKVGGSALAKMEDLNSEKQIRVKEKNALDEETYTNVSMARPHIISCPDDLLISSFIP